MAFCTISVPNSDFDELVQKLRTLVLLQMVSYWKFAGLWRNLAQMVGSFTGMERVDAESLVRCSDLDPPRHSLSVEGTLAD